MKNSFDSDEEGDTSLKYKMVSNILFNLMILNRVTKAE